MMVKDLHTLLGGRPQSSNFQNSVALQSLIKPAGAALGGSGNTSSTAKSKKIMVKQHSTASQQSTSSTSSSVQSAPEQSAIKQQSPSRFSTSSLERHILPQHHLHHTNQQHQQQQPHNAAYVTALPAYSDRDVMLSNTSNANALYKAAAKDDATRKVEAIDSSESVTQSTENLSSTVKKRKKGLRFGFGSKKSNSETSSKSKQS